MYYFYTGHQLFVAIPIPKFSRAVCDVVKHPPVSLRVTYDRAYTARRGTAGVRMVVLPNNKLSVKPIEYFVAIELGCSQVLVALETTPRRQKLATVAQHNLRT